MLFGGRAAFFPNPKSTVRGERRTTAEGNDRSLPQLRDAKVEYVWGGTLDFAMDVMPHAEEIDGMLRPRLRRPRVAAATWMGAKLAGVICGDPDDNPFSRIAFPAAPLGLRSGNTWPCP